MQEADVKRDNMVDNAGDQLSYFLAFEEHVGTIHTYPLVIRCALKTQLKATAFPLAGIRVRILVST